MPKLDFKTVLTQIENRDYIFSYEDQYSGVKYYAPNDEYDCFVIAVHHGAGLAVETEFFETDDFEPLVIHGSEHPSEYGYQVVFPGIPYAPQLTQRYESL